MWIGYTCGVTAWWKESSSIWVSVSVIFMHRVIYGVHYDADCKERVTIFIFVLWKVCSFIWCFKRLAITYLRSNIKQCSIVLFRRKRCKKKQTHGSHWWLINSSWDVGRIVTWYNVYSGYVRRRNAPLYSKVLVIGFQNKETDICCNFDDILHFIRTKFPMKQRVQEVSTLDSFLSCTFFYSDRIQ